MNNDKTVSARLYDSSDEHTLQMLREALEDPDGEIILCIFREKEDGSQDIFTQFKGSRSNGEGMISGMHGLAVGMGQANSVISFIDQSISVLRRAGACIRESIRRSSTNN